MIRRPINRAAIFVLTASLAVMDQVPISEAAEIPEKAIAELVQPYLDAEIVNAVSIGVVSGDQSWTANFGKLSKAINRAPSDTTIYEIGSETKVFTGILLAHEVEAGRLQLDQPIGTLMTKLNTENKKVGDSILLRHLSTHTSGLPRMPNNMEPADPTNPYADYGRERLIDFMCQVQPTRAPDVSFEYSNLAVGLLGDLIAAEAHVDYETIMKRTIATPLGMRDTCLKLNDDQTKRLAPPHNADLAPEKNWDFDAFAGAGSIRSTAADMIRFIQANLNPPEGTLGKAIDLAWKQHLPAKGDDFAMGLGWHIARDGKTRWHNGQTGGYRSMLMVNRDVHAGVIVLSNTASGEVDAIGESIMQTLAGMKVKPRTFPAMKKVDPQVVAQLAGHYQLVPGFVLEVRANDDQLFVRATGQPELRVYPKSETEWYYKIVDAQLTFERPQSGQCTAVTLHQNGRDMKAQRIEQ